MKFPLIANTLSNPTPNPATFRGKTFTHPASQSGTEDHVKKITFLMNRDGDCSLAPAFDVTYHTNPSGALDGNAPVKLWPEFAEAAGNSC